MDPAPAAPAIAFSASVAMYGWGGLRHHQVQRLVAEPVAQLIPRLAVPAAFLVVLAARSHTDSDSGRVDWRSDYDSLRYSTVDPPDSVTSEMLAFLKHFDLSFGAFDFVITPDQEWIMLECNPAGAYGWIEDALGLPITDAVAALLANEART